MVDVVLIRVHELLLLVARAAVAVVVVQATTATTLTWEVVRIELGL